MTIKITSTKNQERHIYDNVTAIDLSNCANKLKDEYNISKNDQIIHNLVQDFLIYYNIAKNLLRI